MEENINIQEQQPEPVNKVNSAATNGLKLAIISIVFALISSLIPQNVTGGILAIVITILKLAATITFLWYAMKKFSQSNAAVQGFTTYGTVFSYGFLTSLFSGIILAVYTFISMKWINPEAVQAVRDNFQQQLSQVQGVDMGMIEGVFNNLEIYSTVGSLISAIIYGLIFSAILASSTKINPTNNFGSQY